MSEDGRALALYLLTCPHGTIAGVFRLPDGYACEDLQWTSERVREAFKETVAQGFANRCETTKWVWIRKHFEWNKPENPNQRKAAEKMAAQVPQECDWRLDFIRDCAAFIGVITEPLSNPSETVSKPVAVAVAVDKEEANASLSATNVADLPIDCPHGKILDLWAEHCPTLTQPRRNLWTTSDGARTLRSRWRWLLTASENGKRLATDEPEALAWFAKFFAYVASCPHLRGENSRGWQADLAWVLKPANFAKVMQGNYERKEAA